MKKQKHFDLHHHLVAWLGITALLTTMFLAVAPLNSTVSEAQANSFSVSSFIGLYGVDTYTVESHSPIETVFAITMGASEDGQTLNQLDIGFGNEGGTSAWTNADVTSTVLADLDGYSDMSGIVLYKDSEFGTTGMIDPWDDYFIALDNPQYSANTLSLTPLMTETITTGDVYMIGFQTAEAGFTDGDAFSISFQANGVTTSGSSPTNEAVNAAIVSIDDSNEWGENTGELISVKALDGNFNSGSRLELIFSASLSDITWNGVTSNDIDWYVWARDVDWTPRTAGDTAAFAPISTTNVANDTLVLTLGNGVDFADGDTLEVSVPLTDWTWIWDEVELDLTGPTLDAVIFNDGNSDGEYSTAGDCADFIFNEAIDQDTIFATGLQNTMVPSGPVPEFPPVLLQWKAPNIVEACLTDVVGDVVGRTFDPHVSVTDLAGNADNTTTPPAMAAGTAPTEVAGIALLDEDTVEFGVDAYDVTVTWDTYSDVDCDHLDIFLLPSDIPLQMSGHDRLNDSDLSCSSTSFRADTDVSGYFLWEDSRADFTQDYGSRTEWYDLNSETNYVAYVVASSEAHASETLTNVAIGQSAPTQFTGEWGGGGTEDWDMNPYLWAYTPEWGATVPTNTRNISIVWSEQMNATSAASTDNFTVQYDSDDDEDPDTALSIDSISYDSETWTTSILLAEDLPSTANIRVQVNTTATITDNMGTATGYADYFYFYTSGTADTTGPVIVDSSVVDSDTGVSTFEPITISFSESIDSSLLSENDVAFSPMVAGHDVSYDTWGDRLEIRFVNPMEGNTGYTMTLNSSIQDLAGNALAETPITFTTGSADETEPTVRGAWGDTWELVIPFSMTMNEETVTNPNNISIINDATGAPLNLSGASMWYDFEFNELIIEGLDLEEDANLSGTFTSNAKGANGVALDQDSGNNSFTISVAGMNDYGFDNMTMTEGDTYDFGYMDDEMGAYTTDFMMFSPAWVWPRNSMTNQTATYDLGFPINVEGGLDDGSDVIIQFSAGYDLSGEIAMNSNDFWASGDLNGGGDGIVTVASITADNSAKTLTLDLSVLDDEGSPTTTSSNDYLDFSLTGIINPADSALVDFSVYPATGGKSLFFTVKNASGLTILDNLESERFEMIEEGSGSISGTVLDNNGDPVEGATVYAENWAVGMMPATTAANGTWEITGLPTSDPGCATCDQYYWLWVDAPAGYIDGNNWNEVVLSDATPTSTGNSLYVNAADCVISGTISHTGTSGDVIVMASGPMGWVEDDVTLSGNSTDYSLSLMQGDWDVGVEPKFWNGQTFAPPPRTMVSCTAANTPVDNDITIEAASYTITGTVTDQNGNGLGNVHVDAWNNNSWGGGGGAWGDTASDGSYTLYVSSGNYSVNIWKEGLGWTPDQSVYLDEDNTSATANFTINKPSSTVSGTVTDEAGNPLAWASVEAFPATGGFYDHAWSQTDADGNFSMYMNAGTWNFEVWAYPYGKVPAASGVTTTNVVIAASTDYTGIDFQYDESAFNTVSGQVLDSESNGVPNAMIWCDEVNSSTGMYTGNFNSDMSDADGNYSIRLPKTSASTSYTCMANSWEKGDSDPTTDIDNSTAAVTGQDITFGTQYTVTISITGAPSDVTWASTDAWNPATFRGNWADMSLSSGAGSTTMQLGDGTYEVHTWIDGFGDFDADLTVAGADTSVTIDIAEFLANSITISGTVSDGTNGVPYAWVDAFNTNNGKVRGTNTDDSGVYSLTVSEGTWEVRADAPNFVSGTPTSVSETGTVNLTIESADATVSGLVYQSNGTTVANGGWVWAESDGGAFATAPVNGDGTYSLGVSTGSGTWTVNAGDMGYEGSTTAAVGSTVANITMDTAIGWWDETIEPGGGTVDPDEGYVFTDEDNTGVNIAFDPGDLGTGDPATVTIQPTVAPTTMNKVAINAIDITAVQGDQNISDLSSSVDLDIVLDTTDINNLIDNNEVIVELHRNDFENVVVSSWSSDNNDFVPADATTIQVTVDGTAMDADLFMDNLVDDNNYCGTTVETCEITYDSGTQHLTIFGLITSSDVTDPSVPSGLAATAGNGSVALAWTANSDSDLLEYEVYRSTSSSVALTAGNQLNSTQLTTNSFTDSTAVNGTAYYYVVTAVDTSGNESAAPTAVTATPTAGDDEEEEVVAAISVGGGSSGSSAADQTYFADDEEETAEEDLYGSADEEVADEVADEEAVAETTEEAVEETAEEVVEDTGPDYVDHWAEDYIMQVMELGIAEGVSEDKFAPDTEITRVELTKMVVNAAGYEVPEMAEETSFSDVDLEAWYAPYVQVAEEEGLVEGYSDGTFGVAEEVNRAEALKILFESTLGEEILIDETQGMLANFGLEENPFTDLELEEWYAKYVLHALTHDIVGGYGDGTFGPDNSITRAEFSKILVLAMELE